MCFLESVKEIQKERQPSGSQGYLPALIEPFQGLSFQDFESLVVFAAELETLTGHDNADQPNLDDPSRWTRSLPEVLQRAGFQVLPMTVSNSDKILPMRSIPIDSNHIKEALISELREALPSGAKDALQLLSYVFEAVDNCHEHAYSDSYPLHLRRAWTCAMVEQEAQIMRFVVYDQGVTIPHMSGRWSLREETMSALGRLHDGSICHGALINHAVSTRVTSKVGSGGAGMTMLPSGIDACQGGRLTIRSGRGFYAKSASKAAEFGSNLRILNGTLVSWEVGLKGAP